MVIQAIVMSESEIDGYAVSGVMLGDRNFHQIKEFLHADITIGIAHSVNAVQRNIYHKTYSQTIVPALGYGCIIVIKLANQNCTLVHI